MAILMKGPARNRPESARAVDLTLFHLLRVRLVHFVGVKRRILLVLGCAVFFHFGLFHTETSCHELVVIMVI